MGEHDGQKKKTGKAESPRNKSNESLEDSIEVEISPGREFWVSGTPVKPGDIVRVTTADYWAIHKWCKILSGRPLSSEEVQGLAEREAERQRQWQEKQARSNRELEAANETSLPREAWAFHEVAETDRELAWRYESELEAEGKGGRHWLQLREIEREWIREEVRGIEMLMEPLKEIPTERDPGLGEYIHGHREAFFLDSKELHLFEIDWTASNGRLVEGFKRWLEETPSWKKAEFEKKQKTGRKQNTSRLVSLAILRVSEAGYTCKEGSKLIWELVIATGTEDRTVKESWSRWKRTAVAEIEKVKELAEKCHGWAFTLKNRLPEDLPESGEIGRHRRVGRGTAKWGK